LDHPVGAGGLALLGVGVVLLKLGLDDADKAASVIGALAALAGLGVSAYGARLAAIGGGSRTKPEAVQQINTGGSGQQYITQTGDIHVRADDQP
jgi:hypothetical protein